MARVVNFLECTRCRQNIPVALLNQGTETRCPGCNRPFQAWVFPAILRTTESSHGETLTDLTDASCFYHAEKKAASSCEGCGRFICSLCEVAFNQKKYCPQCLEKAEAKGHIKNIVRKRLLHDDIALSLSLLPLLVWPFTLITAPAALFIALWNWKTPTTLIPRSKVRFLLAIFFSLLQIIGWIIGLILIFTQV